MGMIRHQAITQQGKFVKGCILLSVEVDQTVWIGIKDILMIVAALSNVMRHANDDDASESSHWEAIISHECSPASQKW